MIVSLVETYVDPFDRICHGLGKPATTDLKEAILV